MKNLFILLSLLLLTACSTGSKNIPDSFSATSEEGLVAGTITFEGDTPVNEIYRFFYRPILGERKFIRQNSGKVMITMREGKGKAFNGDFNNKKTYLFVLKLKPGSYAFTQYNYLDHYGPAGMVSSSKEFALPFEVKKGEISYVGEYTYKDKAEKGTPRIFVSSSITRDIKELKLKYTAIEWDRTADKTPKSGNTGGGIIEFL